MINEASAILAARRHVSLRRLVAPGPDAAALEQIFRAAAQAPDHGLLLPWRFILIQEERRRELADVFVEALVERDPLAGKEACEAAAKKAFHAPCVIAAVLVDETGNRIPVAEKLVSLGCAIQNMLILAQALGFGSGLASGAAMNVAGMRRLLRLAPYEQAVCFIGFGTGSPARAPRERPAAERFVSYL
ncbi:nitroreductase family protein [Massilia oculi]|uniref:Putative NAD(P)H nitroreductase n=1 Tax=Massilia hydrophila TaxID=3044279 RepID=A0ABS7Y421_9BURK|nr:nitroreductase family protein [Massilia oculi]MCA1854416.1 nitroreductase family protein [Massilia oculi]